MNGVSLLKTTVCLVTATAAVCGLAACGAKSATTSTSTTPTSPTSPLPATASFTATYDENPVPFRATGCSFSTPQGWFTPVRLQETGGAAVTVSTLTQKLDGAAASALAESFNSRFGACASADFSPGMVLARGSVCAIVGICTTSAFSNYQFQITGVDANGHSITFDSPILQFGARPAGAPSEVSRASIGRMSVLPVR